MKEVESELVKSSQDIYRKNHTNNYYHGNIDRCTAEKLLRDTYHDQAQIAMSMASSVATDTTVSSPLDGLFLIRKCSACPEDFSLSMIAAKGNCYHYRISHSIDAYYVLDDGPLIHGLDELIKHYQFDPHGLPCRLSLKFVPKMILPANARIIGNTNPLHVAVSCVCMLTFF